MVSAVLRSHGYDFWDFGQGLTVEQLVELTEEHQVEILLISTLMLASALKIKSVRAQLTARGRAVKIIAGGAPFRFDSALWRQVGADADGKNATDIVAVLAEVVSGHG
jgi:methanogenic corrinoid protein MtbC1